jgi:hypothetical protein
MIVSETEREARLRVAAASARCRQAEEAVVLALAKGDAAGEAAAIEKHDAARRHLVYTETLEIAVRNRLARAGKAATC